MTSFGHKPIAGDIPLGLPALIEELQEQSVPLEEVYRQARLPTSLTSASNTPLSTEMRLALFRAARNLSMRPDTALRAGQRQKISNFGVYGFALATSPTFAQAFTFGRENIDLAGVVLRVTFERRGDVGVLMSHNPRALGDLLPFVAEFWRASMTTLMSAVIGRDFPSREMFFPYPAPRHAVEYSRAFNCPVHFNSNRMEWHFDISILNEPCVDAESVTNIVCQDFCNRIISSDGSTQLQRDVRSLCIGRPVGTVTAKTVASDLGLSLRTFYRRLSDEGMTFQKLLDETWCSIAIEYLNNTRLPVEEIAFRCGYQDPSNFRKAFKRWTGSSPTVVRNTSADSH